MKNEGLLADVRKERLVNINLMFNFSIIILLF